MLIKHDLLQVFKSAKTETKRQALEDGYRVGLVDSVVASLEQQRGTIQYHQAKRLPKPIVSRSELVLAGDWALTQRGQPFIIGEDGHGE